MISKKQNEYLQNCNHLWNIKYGATGSGKSFLDYSVVIPKRILATRGEGLITLFGYTRDTFERNILQPMRDIWGQSLVPQLKSGNTINLFGKTCYVLGADKVTSVARIQGQTIEYAYGDEITTWSQPLFEMLKSRLRCEHSVFDGTCNPDSPTHWFKEFLDSNADIYQQKYTIDENPFLPSRFVEELKKEYEGTVYYDRYILGNWTKAEGLIWPMYEKALEKIECNAVDFPVEKMRVSIDYGTLNAFAALLWLKIDNIWYAERGYYYSGRDQHRTKTDNDYLQDLELWLADILEVWNNKRESGQQMPSIKCIIDPSAASFIALLRRQKWATVIQADNNVLDGIRETATCLQLGYIKVNPDIKEIKDEFQGYVWDESTEEERPLKENDHLCDSLRYLCKTMRLVKPKEEYNSLWTGRRVR